MKIIQKTALALIRLKFRLLTIMNKELAARQAFKLFCTPQVRTRITPPAFFNQARPLSFTFNGLQVQGYSWHPGTGKKALLIHGFESSAVNFGEYAELLVAAGFEVLAFDAPAHGKSDGSRINALDYKNMLLYVFEKYGPFDACLAHSFGGLSLSLALAETAVPAKARVVLIAPATESLTALRLFLNFIGILHPQVIANVKDQVVRISGHPIEWFSVTRSLPILSIPVLWVHDEEDKITPFTDMTGIMKSSGPNIQYLITKGLGHRRIYREPAIMKQVVEFLSAE